MFTSFFDNLRIRSLRYGYKLAALPKIIFQRFPGVNYITTLSVQLHTFCFCTEKKLQAITITTDLIPKRAPCSIVPTCFFFIINRSNCAIDMVTKLLSHIRPAWPYWALFQKSVRWRTSPGYWWRYSNRESLYNSTLEGWTTSLQYRWLGGLGTSASFPVFFFFKLSIRCVS